jgi:hypothetical protein
VAVVVSPDERPKGTAAARRRPNTLVAVCFRYGSASSG